VSKADGVDAESLFTFRSAVPPINLQLEFLGFRLNIPWIGGRYLCIRMHVPLGRLLKAVHLLFRNGEARPSHRGHALMRDRDHSPACACPSSHTETRLQGAAQFWKSDPATQARVLQAIRKTGVKSVVGHSWDDVTSRILSKTPAQQFADSRRSFRRQGLPLWLAFHTPQIVSCRVSLVRTRLPVSNSYNTHPKAQMCARLSAYFPGACSGLM